VDGIPEGSESMMRGTQRLIAGMVTGIARKRRRASPARRNQE